MTWNTVTFTEGGKVRALSLEGWGGEDKDNGGNISTTPSPQSVEAQEAQQMMSTVTCTGNWINNCWSHRHGPVKDKTHAPAQGRVSVRAGLTPENKI